MVEVLIGDILESKAQTLVNTVNCVGVMGKGIALGFKKRFPDMYKDYLNRCKLGQIKLGQPYLYRRLIKPWILNFPTKEHWRSIASLDAMIKGMCYLKNHYKEWGITSIVVPPLGCGEGQRFPKQCERGWRARRDYIADWYQDEESLKTAGVEDCTAYRPADHRGCCALLRAG